jgi:hypothetical protein
MTRYGFGDLKIEFDDSGGVLRDMSQYVMSINGMDKEAILEEITAAGDDFEQYASGMTRVNVITITGLYDDTASTGPDVVFNAVGNATTRTLKFTWGGTKTTSVECIIKKYSRKPSRGELTKFEVELQPTGVVTEV